MSCWTFEPCGSGAAASCQLAVYIPDATGTAAYSILGKNVDNPPPLPQQVRRFVDQANHRGTWVTLGTFDFPEGVANLDLYNVGTGTARIAADAARATCR